MTDPIQKEITTHERNWSAIYKKNDADSFETLLTDDFLYTSPVGEVVDRKTYLYNLKEKVVLMTSVEVSDELIRVYGDTALVTATWTVDEAYRGFPTKGPCRITKVWVKQKGQWKAAAFQVTFVTEYKKN